MQLKIKINGIEESTFTSFDEKNTEELKELFKLFDKFSPNIKIYVNFLEHINMKSFLIYKTKKETKKNEH